MSGGNFGPIGYISLTEGLSGDFIRRDEYNVRGQIGTYDNTVGDFSVLPPGGDGKVLTARPALSNGMAWESVAPITINTAAPLAGGGSVSPGGTLNLTFSGGGAITVNGSTFLTVGGSPVSLGGTLTLTNTALNDYFGTGDWGAGNSISFGAGSTYVLLVGNACSSAAGATSSIAMGAGARAGGNNCVSIGNGAGAIASVGPSNIYIGASTGSSNSNATGLNVFVGHNAGLLQATCAQTVIIGGNAASSGSTGATQTVCIGTATVIRDSSVIIGYSASAATTRSTVIGWSAAATQASSVCVGDGAGCSGASGTSIGSSASVSGISGVAVGAASSAGASVTTIGASAGSSTATNGVFIGTDAGDNSAGAGMVAIGYQAARGPSVSNGTFIGYQAGNACTGGQNTLIGWSAGTGVTTGTLNTLVGNNVQLAAGTVQGTVAVGAGNTVNSNSTAIGQGASAGGTSAVSIGQGTTCGGNSGVAVGRSASCSGATGLALGANASASAITANAIGYLVSNATTNTTVIGTATDTAHIVKSTGFFRSNRPYSCQAGRTNGTTQTLTLPGPVTLTINNTPWDNIGGSVSGNTILVQDLSMWYTVNAFMSINSWTSTGGNTLYLKIHYYNGTTDVVIGANTFVVNATTTDGMISCTAYFRATASAGQYVYCDVTRTGSGTSSDPVIGYYTLTLERAV